MRRERKQGEGALRPTKPHPAMPVWESEQRADSPRLSLSTRVGPDLPPGKGESGKTRPEQLRQDYETGVRQETVSHLTDRTTETPKDTAWLRGAGTGSKL